MSNRNTLGSWTVDLQKNGGDWSYEIRTVEPHNYAGGPGIHIASISKYLWNREQVASMAAAAPDMFAALEEIAEMNTGNIRDDPHDVREIARAALAKARGKS